MGISKASSAEKQGFIPLLLPTLVSSGEDYLFLNVFSQDLDLVLELIGGIQQLVAVEDDMRCKEDD